MKYLLIIFCSLFIQKTGVKNLPLAEFLAEYKNTTNKQVVDVRTPEEWKAGKIASAYTIDFTDEAFANNLGKLDKQKPVFVYCAAGGRSSKAAKIMEAQGFKYVVNLTQAGFNDLKRMGLK